MRELMSSRVTGLDGSVDKRSSSPGCVGRPQSLTFILVR